MNKNSKRLIEIHMKCFINTSKTSKIKIISVRSGLFLLPNFSSFLVFYKFTLHLSAVIFNLHIFFNSVNLFLSCFPNLRCIS